MYCKGVKPIAVEVHSGLKQLTPLLSSAHKYVGELNALQNGSSNISNGLFQLPIVLYAYV